MSENTETSNPGISNIGQIAIAVSDLQQSITFYRDNLGLPLIFDVPPNMAFFDCGGIRLMLTTPQGGDEKDHRTSVIYYKVDELEGAVKALKARGVGFEREPHLVAKMEDHELWIGFLRDPDENLIGVMAEVR